jgi:hypothetical protein
MTRTHEKSPATDANRLKAISAALCHDLTIHAGFAANGEAMLQLGSGGVDRVSDVALLTGDGQDVELVDERFRCVAIPAHEVPTAKNRIDLVFAVIVDEDPDGVYGLMKIGWGGNFHQSNDLVDAAIHLLLVTPVQRRTDREIKRRRREDKDCQGKAKFGRALEAPLRSCCISVSKRRLAASRAPTQEAGADEACAAASSNQLAALMGISLCRHVICFRQCWRHPFHHVHAKRHLEP